MAGALIAVVEDEPEMGNLLTQVLSESGYRCASATNGTEGLALSREVDLMLVDVMMPAMNGFAMVEEMRRQGVKTPVIYLSAKDKTKDVVRGLEAGGDDYLIKPFKLEELLARIKAALRRSRDTATELVWGDFRLDTSARKATRGSRDLHFSATEFQLLEAFLRCPDEVLSKRILLQKVWGDDGYRDDNIVELYVNYVRKKTEAYGGTRIIHTVRGKGYILADREPEP
ncbi:MAG: response regulator transcription factor [Armatimonadetes bacterium]|nr:response regulator transcription factor [Armatimonadota bacterium]